MGEGAVCRLITSSIRLLMKYTSTIFWLRAPGPRAIGKELKLRILILEILWEILHLP
jgi:hypothetical protein